MQMYKINKALDDNYMNHQMVKEAFPGEGKTLWRRRGSHLLVLTECSLANSLGDSDMIETLGEVVSNLERNLADKVPFTIRLNACKAQGHKRFCLPANEVEGWALNKLSGLGFEICSARVVNEGRVVSMRQGKKNTHGSVVVDGVLKVVDRDALIRSLTSGIGHAKSYGFGLLDVFRC